MNNELIDNVVMDGIDMKDYPDLCDAFILSADYDGLPMTDEQLNEINNDTEFVYSQAIKQLF